MKAAQCYLRKQPVAFEFVVPEVKQWEVMLKRANLGERPRQISIAGGVILLLILLFVIRGQIEGYYTRRWESMKNNVADLDALQQKIHTYRPWFEPTPLTTQTVEALVSVFPEQGDVWAKTIHITQDGKVTCTGFTKSQAAVLALHAKLRAHAGVSDVQILSERGDSPIQFTITFKYDPHQ